MARQRIALAAHRRAGRHRRRRAATSPPTRPRTAPARHSASTAEPADDRASRVAPARPAIAWLLAAGTGLALAVFAAHTLNSDGIAGFFREGDASYFHATALDPFGTGHTFVVAGHASEIPYRYGRIGLPILGWLVAGGRPGLVAWGLVLVHLVAIAAVPGLAAVLLDEYNVPPVAGAVVLVSPLLFVRSNVCAEPLLVACILLAYVLEAKGRRRSALAVLAFAILVKEVAVLALVPWVWRALRRGQMRTAAACAWVLVPYAAWSVCVRIRDGTFPFFAPTKSRSQALSWPGVGISRVLDRGTPQHVAVVSVVLVTVALGCIGAYAARGLALGGLAAVFTALTACLGENTLAFSAETLRLLVVPQVFILLCLAVAMHGRIRPRPAAGAVSARAY